MEIKRIYADLRVNDTATDRGAHRQTELLRSARAQALPDRKTSSQSVSLLAAALQTGLDRSKLGIIVLDELAKPDLFEERVLPARRAVGAAVGHVRALAVQRARGARDVVGGSVGEEVG